MEEANLHCQEKTHVVNAWKQGGSSETDWSFRIVYNELAITAGKAKFCRENRIDYAIDNDVECFHGASSATNLNLFHARNGALR